MIDSFSDMASDTGAYKMPIQHHVKENLIIRKLGLSKRLFYRIESIRCTFMLPTYSNALHCGLT